jgi:hypothetical protein
MSMEEPMVVAPELGRDPAPFTLPQFGIYDRMLARMFGNDPDGVVDRLTEFSRPVSGAYYYAPSLNALNQLAGKE